MPIIRFYFSLQHVELFCIYLFKKYLTKQNLPETSKGMQHVTFMDEKRTFISVTLEITSENGGVICTKKLVNLDKEV